MSAGSAAEPVVFDSWIIDVEDEAAFEGDLTAKELHEKLFGEDKEADLLSARIAEFGENGLAEKRYVFIKGLGEANAKECRMLFGKAAKAVGAMHGKEAAFRAGKEFRHVKAAVEGYGLGQYRFDKYSGKPGKEPSRLTVLNSAKEDIEEGTLVAKKTAYARDLTNEPSNVLFPEALAEEAKRLDGAFGMKVAILGKEEIESLGMGLYLAVAQGSRREPQLISIDYDGDPESGERLAIVGKGMCYDSGGYSIKTSEGMAGMNTDMEGAAISMAAISAIAEASLKINISVVIPACENMISAFSIVPGNIVKARNGIFVEIANTDAEGRLTLADALCYAADAKKATKLLDIATLTGSCAMALGSSFIGAFASDEEFYSTLLKSSEESGDGIWRLPLAKEYKEMIKSSPAMLKNIGGRQAGSITAALFLQEFTSNLPWIHLDIAGTGRTDKAEGIYSKGATAFGVSLLFSLAKNLARASG